MPAKSTPSDQRKSNVFSWRAFWCVAGVYAALGGLVYGMSLPNGFVHDDEDQITLNETIKSLSNVGSFFAGSTMNPAGRVNFGGIYYKPVMTTLYSVIWVLGGGSSFGYHLVQLILHVANAALVFAFFAFFFEHWMAFFLGLIFLVHPMNTETVVYIADLQDILFLFFGMIAINLCVWQRSFGIKTLIAVAFFCFLSLMSKESGMLFLAIIPVFMWIHCGPKRFWQTAWAGAFVFGVYLFFRLGLAHLSMTAEHNIVQVGRATFWTRLQTSPKILTHYFGKFFFPRDLLMTEDWIVSVRSLADFWFPLAVDAVFVGLVVWLWRVRHTRALAFFIAWFAVGMALHLQFFPLDGTVADRWFYFPMIGLLGLLAEPLQAKWSAISRNMKTLFTGVIVIILGLFSLRAYARSLDWKDGITLYVHDVEVDPSSFYMQNNAGVELFRRARFQESLPYFIASVRIAPYWSVNWNNLGADYEALGDAAKAETSYLNSMQNGAYYLAYQNYARVLIQEGRIAEAKEFLEKRALVIFPKNEVLQSYYQHIQAE